MHKNFVAVAVGVFGVAEILRNLENEAERHVLVKRIDSLMPTRDDFRRMVGPILRGTVLGSVLGILPGSGALLASFGAYTVEKKLSKEPQRFGKGAIEGVAGPEAANNAGAQTSFIPMLTLGIPANPVMALMVGAMIIQGIVPGPQVATEQPALFWGIIVSMWVGNLMLIVLNLPLIGIWVRFLKVPYRLLFPMIVLVCCIGIYSVNARPSDVLQVAIFGVLGYGLFKLKFESAPLLLGLVLGGMLEDNLRRGLVLSRGDIGVFLSAPLTLVLLLFAAVVFGSALLPSINKRRQILAEDE